jgi:hypothetical protein
MKLPWYGYEGATHYLWVFTGHSAGIEATAHSLEEAKKLRLQALEQEPSAIVVIAPADGPNLLQMQFDNKDDEVIKLVEEYNKQFLT